jgi:ATP-dependent RNA helicase DeaD
MREIERIINKKFTIGALPTGQQICEQQLIKLMDDIEKVKVNEEEIEAFLPGIYRKLEWLSKEDLLKRVVSLEFNRFLDYYKDAPEIETVSGSDREPREGKRDRGSKGDKQSRQAEAGYTRLFLNVGKQDGFYANQIIDLVNRNMRKGTRPTIGRIDLMQNFSFFEVLQEEAHDVIRALNRAQANGRRIVVEEAGENNGKSDKGGKKRGARGERDSRDSRGERGERGERAEKKSRPEKKERAEKKAKPSREERGYTSARGPKKKDDWKQFFAPENSKWELKGDMPDFEEEGWARRKKKK